MNKKNLFSGLVIAIIVIAVAVGFVDEKDKKNSAAGEPKAVKVVEAKMGTAGESVVAPGTIVPARTVNVSILPGFDGAVSSVSVDVGSHVTKGQILATLDPREQEDFLNGAIAKANQAREDYLLVKTPYRPLQIQEQRDQVDEDQKSIEEAKAHLEETQAHLDLLLHGNRPEQIDAARNGLESEKTTLGVLEATNTREQALFAKDLISRAEMEKSDAELAIQKDKVTEAQDQLNILLQGSRLEEIREARSAVKGAAIAVQKLAETKKKDGERLSLMLMGSRKEQIEAAHQAVMQADATVHNQTQIIGHQFIRAPVAGTIVERNVNPGEVAGPSKSTTARSEMTAPLINNSEALFIIADDSSLQFMANVDQLFFQNVSQGQAGTLTVEALPGREMHARITKIQSLVAPENKDVPGKASPSTPLTFTLWADVANPGGLLVPGQTGILSVSKNMQGIIVPQAAVNAFTIGQGTVFVVKDGVASIRTVRYEGNTQGTVRITSGITAGEQVVVSDTSELKDGMKVTAEKATDADLSTHAPGF